MATVTQVMLTCDVCGNAKDVQTRTFGLDGKTYEIDLCSKDGNGLSEVAAGYIPTARKVTGGHNPRHDGHRPGSRAATAAIGDGARAPGTKTSGRGRVTGSSRPQRRRAEGARKQSAKAVGVPAEKGIYVYGILPADIELAGDMPGVGEHPGLLRVVRSGGLAALVSEVNLAGRPGSPDDRRTHREILDATATEVPVLPVRFGTVLASEDAVAEELLAAHHDEFAAALGQLEGRVEFLVKGRYVREAILGEVVSENKQAARLRDTIGGQDPDAARDARAELGEIINQAVTARRKQDARALEQAMARACVASVVPEQADEPDEVRVAFLAEAGQESELERVTEDLARAWEGRIELQLLGPMAAYDFVRTAKPEVRETAKPR